MVLEEVAADLHLPLKPEQDQLGHLRPKLNYQNPLKKKHEALEAKGVPGEHAGQGLLTGLTLAMKKRMMMKIPSEKLNHQNQKRITKILETK